MAVLIAWSIFACFYRQIPQMLLSVGGDPDRFGSVLKYLECSLCSLIDFVSNVLKALSPGNTTQRPLRRRHLRSTLPTRWSTRTSNTRNRTSTVGIALPTLGIVLPTLGIALHHSEAITYRPPQLYRGRLQAARTDCK